MKKPYVIGVTGGFGTGKSAVAAMLGRLGAVIIDADKIAHDVMQPGNAVYKKVVSVFGSSILSGNGRIDRKRLGKIIFSNKKKRLVLNKIVHPEVIREIDVELSKRRAAGRVYAIDAPLLIEVGLERIVNTLIVVSADRKTQIARCMKRWSLTRGEVEKRIRSQMPLSKKVLMADFIIDNSKSLYAAKKEVEKIWREIEDGRKI
jgi:dephospho-CoA kinase